MPAEQASTSSTPSWTRGRTRIQVHVSAKRNADDRGYSRVFTDDPRSIKKRHIYRSSVNMADELLLQAQELFEGQIVCPCPVH